MLFVLLLLCLVVVNSSIEPIPCYATEYLDQYFMELWDFTSEAWKGKTFSYVSSDYNVPPMAGNYRFQITFCDNIHVYIGDQTSGALGWSYGTMEFFAGMDVTPPIPSHPTAPTTTPTSKEDFEYSAFKEFVQVYSNGDSGAPCENEERSAVVNIYCGIAKANCTQVPGNKGAECLDGGDTHNGFCLCGIQYNTTVGVCTGLALNILSNSCPNSVTIPTTTPLPSPSESTQEGVGIAFGVLAVLLIVCIIGGYVYNFTVHNKRGCTAFPFYDTCTGKKVDPTYQVVPATYGAISV